jgi:probable F420-dependent oxidoreductase
MKYAIDTFITEYTMQPGELARLVEERGFESLWFPEHTHIPSERRSPWPGGDVLPRDYWSAYDPFIALTAAAAATTSLNLATGVCLVIEHDPIVLAKTVATLDKLSNGRFIFGIGGGWNAEEMENHGTDFKTRWRLLRERILAMKAIWTQDEAEFHGEFVNFDKIRADPKPVRKPHPPVHMGGDGATTFDRVVEFCDGWMPIGGRREGPTLEEKITGLRRRFEAAGRDPDALEISSFDARPERETVDRLEAAGVDRVIFKLPTQGHEVVLPLLDQMAKLVS